MPDDPTLNQNNTNPVTPGNTSSDQPSNDTSLPDFMAVSNTASAAPAPSASSTQSDFFPPAGSSEPKKKFGSGKIIATILGILLLVGGIASGIILVLQPQLLKQQAAVTTKYCGDGICNENAASCPKDCGTNVINCGGVQCAAQDCHCTGGDACTGFECSSSTRVSCGNQGRSWCSNAQSGGGMTCCNAGYVCNPSGEGCVPGSTHTQPPSTPPPPTKPPVTPPPPTRTPTPTPTPTPVPKCNSTCTTNANCLSGMICYKVGTATTGNCRNASCTTQTNCVCTTPTPTPTPTPKVTPTPPGPNAVCSSVKAYDSGWSQLSQTQLSGLKPGNNIMICVAGTASSGSFDKARFTINTVVQTETTTKRPNTNDYCQSYTIPTGVTKFTITAQIHHVTLGWVGP